MVIKTTSANVPKIAGKIPPPVMPDFGSFRKKIPGNRSNAVNDNISQNNGQHRDDEDASQDAEELKQAADYLGSLDHGATTPPEASSGAGPPTSGRTG